MGDRVYEVLFLCTGNSARSLMAECAMARWGAGKFRSHSAGSRPQGAPHPTTLQVLRELDYDVSGLRSKSWDEFADSELDFVFSVCDNARDESCPIWPGQPLTAHWGVEDPAAFVGSEEQRRRFFLEIYLELENRVKIFSALPFESLDRLGLQARLEEIGKTSTPADAQGAQRPPARRGS